MIVDDERLVRQGIRTSIDWAEHGIEIAAEARHGEDALHKLEQCPVDLIVTDIRMPVMSGLELAREVKRLKPDLDMVLLSGYEDFHYAAEAMALGIRDYLLKPVAAEKLVSVIARFRDEHRLKQQALQKERIRAQLLSEHLPLMKSRFLYGLIHGRMDAAEAEAKASAMGISLAGPSYCLLVIERDGGAEGKGGNKVEYLPAEAEELSNACLNMAEETLAARYAGFVAGCGDGQWIGIANVPADGGTYGMIRVCEEIRARLKQSLKLCVSVRIGRPVGSLSDIGRAYRETVHKTQPGEAPPQVEAIQPARTKHPSKLIKDVIRFADQRLDQPIGLSEAAAHVDVTSSHLCKVFKDEMGIPFTKWLNKRRVEEAKTLLEKTWLKTYEIADRVGYHDYKYFSSMFKKYVGCSPREYRNFGSAKDGT